MKDLKSGSSEKTVFTMFRFIYKADGKGRSRCVSVVDLLDDKSPSSNAALKQSATAEIPNPNSE